jgi:hypothetical protein
VDSISASSPLLPELKFFARRFTMVEAKEFSEKLSLMKRPYEIKEAMNSFHEERVSEITA